MPKKPALKIKKTTAAIKKKVSARSKPAKTTTKSHAKAVATPPHKRGFMWRLLERKKAEMKAKQDHDERHGLKDWERGGVKASAGFARFNGPRRKVG